MQPSSSTQPLVPVVMAGGFGSRLWPMSRSHYPKQFLSLTHEHSLLQQTLLRLDGLACREPLLICNEEHRFLVAEQMRQLGMASQIILEPFGRNTAPAIALAALQSLKAKPEQDPVLLVLAADHLIKNTTVFQGCIEQAVPLAAENKLVTFGISPTAPETGYGYIQTGDYLADYSAYNIHSFAEKPSQATAERYLAEGNYYWNSGIFMFKASVYLQQLEQHRPDILAAVSQAFDKAEQDLSFIRIDAALFADCPSESIDVALMEKTASAVMLPMQAEWNDVGSWSALWQVSDKDASGNVLQGDVVTENTQRCYINAGSRLVATIGVRDLVVVDTKDALLIAARNEVQQVKKIVEQLQQKGRQELLHHREVYRPWGMHDHIAEGARYHVKKVRVDPGKKTSLQRHYHRAEHWIVVSGTAIVYRGDEQHTVTENESIYIPVGVEHAFENPGKLALEIIEVRTGSYLAEDDIVRNQP